MPKMIKARKWTLGRAGAVLAALATVVAVSVSGAPPASAAAGTTCHNLVREGVNWGGTYFCNYGSEYNYLRSGDLQVFVVAGAHNVFTRWQKPNGAMSAWVNMGGTVRSNGDLGDIDSITVLADGGHYVMLSVFGTDDRKYCNIRDPYTSSWNGWTRGHCDDL